MTPNILFIQVDQLTAGALRAYGNTICQTPNLDQLAQNGAVYENAYCNFPLCAPSRFSMLTGQLASDVGAYDNAAEFGADIPGYPHYLRKAGYQTALSGKMHFIGPDQYHGFEHRLTGELYPADYAWVPNWENEGKRDTNDPRIVRIAGPCKRTVQMDYDEEVTQNAVRHLYDIARSDDNRPFFLQVSYTHPHEPFLCPQKFWDLYEGIDIPLPRTLPDDQQDAHSLRLLQDFGMLGVEFSDAEITRAIRGYYGAVSYIDDQIGQVLNALRDAGLDQNTVIVFTSDHGEMLGQRGLWMKKHFFENAMRVPLMIAGAGIGPTRVTTLASLVDLLPTFCALASIVPDSAPLAGHNILNFRDTPQDDRAIYGEYLAEATPAPMFMIRQGRYKFITSSADGDMLFDLETDPGEWINLAGQEDHADMLETFHQMAREKWDNAALHKAILASQKRRLLVRDAMAKGAPHRWNHGETPDTDVPWYRGKQGYNEWAFKHL